MPTAPRAICLAAISGDLCVFACGRNLTPSLAYDRCHRVEIALECVQIDDQGWRVDLGEWHADLGGWT
jgi:hypothetical protein